jgi:ribosomal protein L37AE/L43A
MMQGEAPATCTHCRTVNTVVAPKGVCLAFWKCSKCGKTFRLPPEFCT